jgi:hypothetical protein
MSEQRVVDAGAPVDHRGLGVSLFNHVWTLLEVGSRTREQNDEMLHAAHASRHHWGVVGAPVNLARGEWQCSRVYSVLGRAEPAIHHGRRCLEICVEHGIGDFDLAFAYEALTRGYAVGGDAVEAGRHRALAEECRAAIADPDDRDHFDEQLATVPFAIS